MGKWVVILMLGYTICFFLSCKKEKAPNPIPIVQMPNTGLYADSILYIQSSDYFVSPEISQTGVYSSFPDGLEIDPSTGDINVNKSETGLKYLVTFTPASGDVKTSYIIISGINYYDKIFNLSAGDSIAVPVYNANDKIALPNANNSDIFDQNGGCKNAGIAVDPTNAIINLAKTVRNQGIDTGATQEVKLAYRINDNSNQALNGLNVKIYFYRTASEIPQYLLDLLNERKGTILKSNTINPSPQTHFFALNSLSTNAKKPARPRPPCIIVVSR
jgi:hypothetical protein